MLIKSHIIKYKYKVYRYLSEIDKAPVTEELRTREDAELAYTNAVNHGSWYRVELHSIDE